MSPTCRRHCRIFLCLFAALSSEETPDPPLSKQLSNLLLQLRRQFLWEIKASSFPGLQSYFYRLQFATFFDGISFSVSSSGVYKVN